MYIIYIYIIFRCLPVCFIYSFPFIKRRHFGVFALDLFLALCRFLHRALYPPIQTLTSVPQSLAYLGGHCLEKVLKKSKASSRGVLNPECFRDFCWSGKRKPCFGFVLDALVKSLAGERTDEWLKGQESVCTQEVSFKHLSWVILLDARQEKEHNEEIFSTVSGVLAGLILFFYYSFNLPSACLSGWDREARGCLLP